MGVLIIPFIIPSVSEPSRLVFGCRVALPKL